MKRAIVLALTTICAAALFAVPAQGKAGKAQTARPGRTGVCVVVVKQENGKRTAPQGRGGRRSPRCRGPRGLRGPRGKQGPRGARGAEGRDGSNGANGSNGRDGATGPAGPKGDPGAPWAGTRYAHVTADVTTSSPTFAELPGSPGPSVTVTVPESGAIQVAASVVAAGGDGAVSLFEDGVQVPGQADYCWGPAGTLFDAPGDPADPEGGIGPFGTPGSLGVFGCATIGRPGPVLFQTTPGRHTYELRYALAACGCNPSTEVRFSERKLWVTPLP